jgi:hypothetical protein
VQVRWAELQLRGAALQLAGAALGHRPDLAAAPVQRQVEGIVGLRVGHAVAPARRRARA